MYLPVVAMYLIVFEADSMLNMIGE